MVSGSRYSILSASVTRSGVQLVPNYRRTPGSLCRLLLPVATIAVASFASCVSAQTAPQLLPYTSRLIAGGGTATPSYPGTCASGFTPTDKYGDGCLGTEIVLGTGASTPGPRSAVGDAAGNVYFTDYANGLVRRVDALTGIVTAVVGGGASAAGTSTGALGTTVKLSHPAAIAFAPNGDLYFSDVGNGQVFKVASTGGVIAGSVGSVSISSGGSGYTTAPTVTFSAPASGTTATGTAVISGGVVTSVTITNAGSGYTSVPTVTFSAPTTGTTATGTAAPTGVISLVAGNSGGTFGYAASNAGTTITPATSYLRAVYGLAFDSKGDLFMVDEYTESVVVLNTNATGTNTVNGVAVAAGTIWKIAGTSTTASAPYCVNGTASGYGCSYGLYTENIPANTDTFDSTYSIALDSNGVVYAGDEYYDSVFKVSTAGILSTYTGTQNTGESYAYQKKALPRGPAGSAFTIGSIFGLAIDANNNVYIGDASNGVIWRVDGAGQSQYAVAGGVGDVGSPATICSNNTDSLGDGCPGLQSILGHSGTGNYATATLPGPGVYGVSVDGYSDLFFGDTENNDVREVASGTQFGPVGANQPVQTVEIHFANGDLPSSATPYTLTSGANNFSLGTAKCGATNSDGTTDCLLPITATPTALGAFSGMLKVTSQLGGVANFSLSGTYIQSPITRTTLSYVASVSCSGTTTYSTTTSVTLTANVTANGPAPPVGSADNITFYATNTTTNAVTNLGTVAVSNLGTVSVPVYGATLPYTFATPGTYGITAVYSGDSYFKTSTGFSTNTITSSLPSFTITPVPYSGPMVNGVPTVAPGETALYSFYVNQNVYSGTITFTVTGLPANSSYSVSPSVGFTATGCSVTNTVALSILTQQGTTVTPAGFGANGRGVWRMVSVLAGLMLALFIGLRRRRVAMRYGQIWMALALLIAATGTVACGKAVGTVLQPATPAGTYTITVTAVPSVGTAPPAITFPLVVN